MVIPILQSFGFVFLLSLFAKVAGCNKERTALNSMSPAGISKKAFNKLSLIRKTLLFRFKIIHLFNQD